MLPESFLKKIQNVDYEAYVKALEIKKEISSYISDLPAFAKRVLKDCFGIPLEILNPRTTEQLLFFIYLKKDDIKKCYGYIIKDYKFYGLKRNLTQAEYEKLIDDISYLGMLANEIFEFEKQFSTINQYKLKIKENIKSTKHNTKAKRGNFEKIIEIIKYISNKINLVALIVLLLSLLVIFIFLSSRKNTGKEHSTQVTNLTELPTKEYKSR